MDDEPTLQQIKQGLEHLRQALEEVESAMIEFEEKLSGTSPVRPQERAGLDLLSIPEACQELGMGKSWLYGKIKSGDIPSIKLGSKIKIRRSALEEYIQNQVIQQPQDTVGQLTDQVQGTVGEVAGQVVQGAHKGAGGTPQQADHAARVDEEREEPTSATHASKK